MATAPLDFLIKRSYFLRRPRRPSFLQRMASLQLTTNVRRPNYNTSVGQPVPVRTNHFKVDRLPNLNVKQWAVDFNSEKTPPKSKASLLQRNKGWWQLGSVQDEFKGIPVIYNGGGIAWSIRDLPFETLNKVVLEKDNVRIGMVYAATINLETLSRYLCGTHSLDVHVIATITFLDALLHDQPSKHYATVLRNSFFDSNKTSNVFDLGGGIQLWRGIFQSARLGPGYMTINVDVAHSAFYRKDMGIIDLIVSNLQLRSENEISRLKTDPRRRKDTAKLVHGLGIYTSHTKRRDGSNRAEKIFAVSWNDSANSYKFDKDGKMITVTQYLKDTYNIVLRYPNFPLLETSGGKSKVPMELCKIAGGQKFPNELLTPQQTSEIVKQAAQPPATRLQTIDNNVKDLKWSTDSNLKDIGLNINRAGIVANSRLLPAPGIAYGPKQSLPVLQPKDGQWRPDGKQLIACPRLESWGICKFTGPRDDTAPFEREIIASGVRYGVHFVAKEPFVQAANPHGDIDKIVWEFHQSTGQKFKKHPQILFFILPGRGNSDLYGEIKRICDTSIGVASQCISGGNLRKVNAQFCQNVWLKVNPKIGGLNTRLSRNPFAVPTLLLGADVSHPSAGALRSGALSIASLASSHDLNGTSFVGQARTQTARLEIIEQLEAMAKNAIKAFVGNSSENPNGTRPVSIIYYRDGVGEGQFAQIKELELSAIKAACAAEGVKAKITVIICQKRHHTRFFPTRPQDGDRLGNVKAGTCVDNEITHPHEFDFFLVAHTSFKGTARPTHYHVIHDENAFRAEVLQKMTYDLCYTFARSTTSVSLVPVAYYAHLVGNRVKAYCSGGSESGSGSKMDVNPELALARLHTKLRTRMWYV